MKRFLIHSVLLILVLLLQGCAAATAQTPSPAILQTGATEPAISAASPTPTQTLPAGPVTTALPEQPIVHASMPGNPSYLDTQMIWECTMGYAYETYETVSLNRGCDSWAINFLERPVSADLETYYPFVDIELAQFGSGGGWFYARMRVYEAAVPVDGSGFSYLFELDKGFDGRGDILIAVENLPLNATEWTVAGVRAWQDTNGDVGGDKAIRPDGSSSGDGYETLIFDAGVGLDPDLVWARRSPTSPKSIEFAFKPSLLGDDPSFLWWGWAIKGDVDPSRFDLVDNYPELFGIDNTCSMEFNGSPMGYPNGCRVIQPTPTPAPTCIQPPKPADDYYWDPYQCKWFQFN